MKNNTRGFISIPAIIIFFLGVVGLGGYYSVQKNIIKNDAEVGKIVNLEKNDNPVEFKELEDNKSPSDSVKDVSEQKKELVVNNNPSTNTLNNIVKNIFSNTSNSSESAVPKGDLVITDFSWKPEVPSINQKDKYLYFDIAIKNIGKEDVFVGENTEFYIYKNEVKKSNEFGGLSIGSGEFVLKPNESKVFTNMGTVHMPNILDSKGQFQIIAMADSNNLIKEWDENNNTLSKNIIISDIKDPEPIVYNHKLEILDFVWETDLSDGKVVGLKNIYTKIKNTGNADIYPANLSAKLYLNNASIDNTYLNVRISDFNKNVILEPGEEESFNLLPYDYPKLLISGEKDLVLYFGGRPSAGTTGDFVEDVLSKKIIAQNSIPRIDRLDVTTISNDKDATVRIYGDNFIGILDIVLVGPDGSIHKYKNYNNAVSNFSKETSIIFSKSILSTLAPGNYKMYFTDGVVSSNNVTLEIISPNQ